MKSVAEDKSMAAIQFYVEVPKLILNKIAHISGAF